MEFFPSFINFAHHRQSKMYWTLFNFSLILFRISILWSLFTWSWYVSIGFNFSKPVAICESIYFSLCTFIFFPTWKEILWCLWIFSTFPPFVPLHVTSYLRESSVRGMLLPQHSREPLGQLKGYYVWTSNLKVIVHVKLMRFLSLVPERCWSLLSSPFDFHWHV